MIKISPVKYLCLVVLYLYVRTSTDGTTSDVELQFSWQLCWRAGQVAQIFSDH